MIIKPSNLVNSKLSYTDIHKSYSRYFLSENFMNNYFGKEFIIHDGPPYANGNLHVGHLLNKTIKDSIARYHIINGKKVEIIFGWDCHGLPIEANVQKLLKNKKQESLSVCEFRKLCSEYADKFIEIQKNETKKYFFLQNKKHYETKEKNYVLNVIKTLFAFNSSGQITKENMPVYYSFEEKTNLAFSEIEYSNIQHYGLYFKVNLTNQNFKLIVYTTQPWTILGNELICINPNTQYVTFEHEGENLICSKSFAIRKNIQNFAAINQEWIIKQKYVIKPFSNVLKKIFQDEYVDDSGTGILHCAPAHGHADYQIFKKYFPNKQVKNCIDQNGFLIDEKFKDFSLINEEKNSEIMIIHVLKKNHNVYELENITHRYPVSWRSKKPVYVLCTEQIILNITRKDIENTKENAEKSLWYGSEGIQTFLQTLENRDLKWCISRQRKWGTPCMLFYDKINNQIVNNEKANAIILELIQQYGEDFWFDNKYIDGIIQSCFQNQNIKPITDTLDVWFDSGCSIITLEKKPDVISEGRDQHRGWFQTTCLINSMLSLDKFAKNIIVHGFVNFKEDMKISKSNKITHKISEQIMSVSGEVIRIVIHSSNYGKDVIFNENTIEQAKKLHLKIYNILRYYVNISKYHFFNDLKIENLINVSIVNKAKEEYNKYSENMNIYSFQNAFKNVCNIMNIASECIRVNRNMIYCGNPNETAYQEAITCIEYISKILYRVCYPIIPATLFYVLKHMKEITDETKLIKYIQHNVIQTREYDNDQEIFETINEIFNQLNLFIENQKQQESVDNIKQTQEIGILIDSKYKYIYSYIQQFCQISFIDSLAKEKQYQNLILYKLDIKGIKIILINLKTKFYKCTRCWRYFETLKETMCDFCYQNNIAEKNNFQ